MGWHMSRLTFDCCIAPHRKRDGWGWKEACCSPECTYGADGTDGTFVIHLFVGSGLNNHIR